MRGWCDELLIGWLVECVSCVVGVLMCWFVGLLCRLCVVLLIAGLLIFLFVDALIVSCVVVLMRWCVDVLRCWFAQLVTRGHVDVLP